jgi:hypothetical protein
MSKISNDKSALSKLRAAKRDITKHDKELEKAAGTSAPKNMPAEILLDAYQLADAAAQFRDETNNKYPELSLNLMSQSLQVAWFGGMVRPSAPVEEDLGFLLNYPIKLLDQAIDILTKNEKTRCPPSQVG